MARPTLGQPFLGHQPQPLAQGIEPVSYTHLDVYKRQLLELALVFLPPGEGAHLLMQLEALVIGLRHLADASPIVRQLMTIPEMRAFAVDFDGEFRQMALAILDAMKIRRERDETS